jgi:hypothetical protein
MSASDAGVVTTGVRTLATEFTTPRSVCKNYGISVAQSVGQRNAW